MTATRSIVLFLTFVSGAVALIFQVVWQRYLAVLMGSEARSISLIVAVFLFGLASGYRFWGNVTARDWSRRKLLKTLGFVELGIAAYGLAFPWLFTSVQPLAYAGPDALLFDLLITSLLLIVPTFLMGATIPLLTAALPQNADEVNSIHARIYGINTLGAFLGALAAGFVMVPMLGLPMSLVVAAIADIVVGMVFVLNRLEGSAHQAEDIPRIPNSFGPWGIYLVVFVTGAVSIALEVLFMRVMSLTAGPSHAVFPTVVGVVILGLAIGSLSLRKRMVTADLVPRELIKLGLILAALHFTIPFWGYWLSHLRISLATIPSNFWVFQIVVVLFTAAFLLPLIIPLGRLLPTGYALMDKTRDDFGKQCGRLYFANTLGTVTGAVVIGYLAFAWFDLPQLFLLNISLLMVVAGVLCYRSRRFNLMGVCGLLAVVVWMMPAWNRQLHRTAIFRHNTPQHYHFKGLFTMPTFGTGETVKFLRDDPTMTVSAYEAMVDAPGRLFKMPSMSISVNGKSDGNTIADYSNMVLTGLIPYLCCEKDTNLNAAVVGLGTGMTTGALALGDDIDKVTTLEISPGVKEALPFFGEFSFSVADNPKSQVVQTDAFRFFSRTDERFDIIVSEPSNPWVVGVENLFTPEFYALASRCLTDDGVFFQWIQMYEINNEILAAITRNVTEAFPESSLFVIGSQDVGVLASRKPLDRPHLARRLAEVGVQKAMYPLGFDDPALLTLLESYETPHMGVMALEATGPRHSIEFPWIGHKASVSRFLVDHASPGGPALRSIGRHLNLSPRRPADFAAWMGRHAADVSLWCDPTPARHSGAFVCGAVEPKLLEYRMLEQPVRLDSIPRHIEAYNALRDEGYIVQDLAMLNAISVKVAEAPADVNADMLLNAVGALVTTYSFEFQWDLATKLLDTMKAANHLKPADETELRQSVLDHRERSQEWLRKYGSSIPAGWFSDTVAAIIRQLNH